MQRQLVKDDTLVIREFSDVLCREAFNNQRVGVLALDLSSDALEIDGERRIVSPIAVPATPVSVVSMSPLAPAGGSLMNLCSDRDTEGVRVAGQFPIEVSQTV